MMLMVFANDILIIFIGLELMSICFYVLAGFLRLRDKLNESALKYFLLGVFMTGFILYGIALIYGITETTNLSQMYLNTKIFTNYVFIVGLGLFVIGFMFKIGVFPFQMWIPDVYEGAPTVVSGMLLLRKDRRSWYNSSDHYSNKCRCLQGDPLQLQQ